jgi:hypothetical protein
MHVLFCPAYSFNDVMDQVIKEVNMNSKKDLVDAGVSRDLRNNVPQLLETFSILLKAAILGKVETITIDVAMPIANQSQSSTYPQVLYHQPKKACFYILKTVSASQRGNPDSRNSAIVLADNIVHNEMDEYKMMIWKNRWSMRQSQMSSRNYCTLVG